MLVWIDLSNSPHPLLFGPVARRIQEDGHELAVTVRDNAQTVELARERWPDAELIGGPSPSGRARKAAALGGRVAALRRWARRRRPDVALSHGSYAQIVAARPLASPWSPPWTTSFSRRTTSPSGSPPPSSSPSPSRRRHSGVSVPRERAVRRYPGLKEGIYLGDFEPDGQIPSGSASSATGVSWS